VAKRVVLLVAVSALAVFLVGQVPAGAGRVFQVVEVTKVVQGTPPPGTQFEVAVSCTGLNGPTESGTLTFDSTGGTQEFDAGGGSQSCTVSEPGTGGASSVTFACAEVENATCGSSTSNSFESDVARVSYTVTNAFEPPPPVAQPPAAVEAAPAFAG
jgi:hypothetical protein